MTRFAYLRDPLFLFSVAAYAFNRFLLKPLLPSPFLHGYFADLIMIPAALPGTLWAQRLAGVRQHDRVPSVIEISLHLGIWAVICEYIGPVLFHRGASDIWDVGAYTAGAIASCLWWNRNEF